MFIRMMSDLHLEFEDYTVPPLPEDNNTVLVLAGDIGLAHRTNLHVRFLPFLQRCSVQFSRVVLIMGNHEHYDGSFIRTEESIQNAINHAHLYNVSLCEKTSVVIDNVAFICATLWTDCDKDSPHSVYLWNSMADARVIRTSDNQTDSNARKFTAFDTYKDHIQAKQFIWEEVDKHKALGNKTVVVVHHGVTPKSVAPQFKGDSLNMFFVSDMTFDIMEHNPDIIVHGHTHIACDYFVDDSLQLCSTRVICNPKGYPGEFGTDSGGFEGTKRIEV